VNTGSAPEQRLPNDGRANFLSWQGRDPLGVNRLWRVGIFWLVQAAVVTIFFARFGIEEKVSGASVPGSADFTTVALFIWPVLYATLMFGTNGGTLTTAVVVALSISRLVAFANSSDPSGAWAEGAQLIILCIIVFVVGNRVAAVRSARAQADESRRAHLAAEARYAGLLRTNSAPILIVDISGLVVESNPAAVSLFGGQRKDHIGANLDDLVGRESARRLLGEQATKDEPLSPPTDATSGTKLARGVVVRIEVEGAPMLYRTDASWMANTSGQDLVQLVFNDVTAEAMRQEWIEAYAARVLNAQEEERRHLAQELHDGPLQALIYLCRRIDEVGRRGDASASRNGGHLEDRRTVLASELEALRHLTEILIGDLRDISRGLRPSVLDDLGLVAATRRLLDDLQQRTGIDTTLGITGSERRLPTPIELALFRVAQEAISNAELHAGPGRVAVGMSFEPAGVRLLVSDDGDGFETEDGTVPPKGSLGLLGMRERLHLVGGQVEVHSSAGSGTTVDAWASTRSAD